MTSGGGVEGGCLCWAVRYRVDGPTENTLRETTHCHCTMCRRTSGAPLVTWTVCAPQDFHWTVGAPARYVSSPGCRRTFCAVCGAKLTFTDEKRPGDVDIAVGSLDAPQLAPPLNQIYGRSRLAWIDIDPQIPFRAEDAPTEATRVSGDPLASHAGSCFCGGVRFTVTGAPLRSSLCHCDICRRETGGPFGAGGVWRRDAVTHSGATTTYASSKKARRHFCPTCGATVFFEDLAGPNVWEVMLALLDDANDLAPACHLFAANAVPGLVMGDDLPRYPRSRTDGPPNPALLRDTLKSQCR